MKARPNEAGLPAEVVSLLLAQFPGAVAQIDQFGRILRWDVGREASLALSEAQWVGKSLDRLFSPPDAARVRSRIEAVFRGDGNHSHGPLELLALNLDRTAGSWSIEFFPWGRQTDTGPCCTVVIRRMAVTHVHEQAQAHAAIAERTENQRLAERQLKRRALELARSNAELRRFAYVASHDMKEPLRMVSMYVQLLRKKHGGALDGAARELIDNAVSSINRIFGLLDALLEYSQAGRGQVPSVEVSLREVVQEAVGNLQVSIEESGAKVEFGELPTIQGERNALVRLFQNLVGNAVKFRREGIHPVVEISAHKAGPHWVIAVSDNGIGISPQYNEKVFEIFQRLHARHEYPGSGIGLAVCKRIVEQHGGRIWFESNPGEGTTFYLSLLENHADQALAPNIPWELS